jgi:hypothetical protein
LVSKPGKWDVSDKAEALTRKGDDPKGWDRASIRLRVHPNHPFPRLSQKDLLLPQRSDVLRLAGDAVLVGAAVACLAFFPLLMVAFTQSQSPPWFWWAVGAAGLLGAAYVAWREWSPDLRELDRY